jgi:hypothetical protein
MSSRSATNSQWKFISSSHYDGFFTTMSPTPSNTIGNSFLEVKRKMTTLSSTTLLSLLVEDVN